jgi:hypothetical protein
MADTNTKTLKMVFTTEGAKALTSRGYRLNELIPFPGAVLGKC